MATEGTMNGSERAGEATARPLRALWAVVRWFFKACGLLVLAIIVVGARRALFVPNDSDTSVQKGEEVWGLFAVMLVVMIVMDVAVRLGRRSGFYSEFMQGYRESRATRKPQHDRPSDDARASGSSGFRDKEARFREKEAGLLRQIRDLEAALARAAEENANLRAQLDGAPRDNERQQAADQRARAQMRELESILAWPGVRRALEKVLHPDTGQGGSKATRTEICQTFHAAMDRLGIGLGG
jgi:hypothetical protein